MIYEFGAGLTFVLSVFFTIGATHMLEQNNFGTMLLLWTIAVTDATIMFFFMAKI
jgi:hypothetical protein